MTRFMNRETGEVLNYKEARAQFREEYDGDDPTNIITFEEIFKAIELEV